MDKLITIILFLILVSTLLLSSTSFCSIVNPSKSIKNITLQTNCKQCADSINNDVMPMIVRSCTSCTDSESGLYTTVVAQASMCGTSPCDNSFVVGASFHGSCPVAKCCILEMKTTIWYGFYDSCFSGKIHRFVRTLSPGESFTYWDAYAQYVFISSLNLCEPANVALKLWYNGLCER